MGSSDMTTHSHTEFVPVIERVPLPRAGRPGRERGSYRTPVGRAVCALRDAAVGYSVYVPLVATDHATVRALRVYAAATAANLLGKGCSATRQDEHGVRIFKIGEKP